MNKRKKYGPLIILAASVFLIAGLIISAAGRPKMILFYSDSCSHCKNVEEYINSNGIKDKLSFQELEVSKNQANASLLQKKARQCGLDPNQGLGVPFFFDGEKCLIGDQDIINYFQK